MASYDFEVDLQSLVQAAQGTSEAIQLFKDKDDLGDGDVWDAVDEFKDRWERGMNDLVGDVEEIAGRLGKVAMKYAEFDKDGNTTLTKVAADVRSVKVRGTA
jgi:hypothetical protein